MSEDKKWLKVSVIFIADSLWRWTNVATIYVRLDIIIKCWLIILSDYEFIHFINS